MRIQIVVACVLMIGVSAEAQRPTFRELVATSRSDVSVTVTGNHPRFDFDRILRGTDVVVRAIVGQAQTYLSDDGADIFTTYELINPDVLFSVKPLPRVPPGEILAPNALALTQRGGAVPIEGFTATMLDSDMVPLTFGLDVVLLLREHDKKYWLSENYSVFQVRDATIVPLGRVPDPPTQFAGMKSDAFVREVLTRRRQVANK
jgi:hypothetical protein